MKVLSTELGDSLERVGTGRTGGGLEAFKQSLLDFLWFFYVSLSQESKGILHRQEKGKHPEGPGVLAKYITLAY